MVVWDWDDIVVSSGGWWLVLIGLGLLLLGLVVGYFMGQRAERKRHLDYPAPVPRNNVWDEGPGV